MITCIYDYIFKKSCIKFIILIHKIKWYHKYMSYSEKMHEYSNHYFRTFKSRAPTFLLISFTLDPLIEPYFIYYLFVLPLNFEDVERENEKMYYCQKG